MELENLVIQQFATYFKHKPEILAKAPGRVNLIGEHTDYNDGFVLPCAIDYATVIAGSSRSDREIHLVALDYHNEQDSFSLDRPILFHPTKMWCNYLRGVVSVLLASGIQLSGANLVISGNVPQGAGLSSSASLEVALGYALQALNGFSLSGVEIAKIGQQAENQFVGCQCGIMDQLISALGQINHALLIDCASLNTRTITLPDNMQLLIVNSNVKRGLVGSEYNIRRQQCEDAARYFNVNKLREVTLERFFYEASSLDALTARRARHVITENERTLAAAIALEQNNIAVLSHLMALSHLSMKHDFSITVPAIDFLVDEIHQEIGLLGGVRMTGGGFGGCVIAVVPNDAVLAIEQRIQRVYTAKTGLTASVYLCQASEGATAIRR